MQTHSPAPTSAEPGSGLASPRGWGESSGQEPRVPRPRLSHSAADVGAGSGAGAGSGPGAPAAGMGAGATGTGGGLGNPGGRSAAAAARLPIQRLSIPGLAESAIRLHPGARDKLDRFTQNRRVRQTRAILGNLGLAGGIRGKDARYAFKSQIHAERKWKRMFGEDEPDQAETKKPGEDNAKCCADGSSPFPANRHDASNHEPATNRPDAGAQTDTDAEPVDAGAAVAAVSAAAGGGGAGGDATSAPLPMPDEGTTPEHHKRSDAEKAAHASETRKVFDTRRSTQRSLAEIKAAQAARLADRREKVGKLGQRHGKVRAEVKKHFQKPTEAPVTKFRGHSIDYSYLDEQRSARGAARAGHGALSSRLSSRGVHRQGVQDHVEAHRQAQMVGDFFASVEG